MNDSIQMIASRYLLAQCNQSSYWGRGGAGMMFICKEDDTLLLLLRAPGVDQGGTWGIPGGGLSEEWMGTPIPEHLVLKDNDPLFLKGAKEEVREECGSMPSKYKVIGQTLYEDCGFKYKTFICEVPLSVKESWKLVANWETSAFKWVQISEARSMGRLHFGVKYTLNRWRG